MSIFLNQMAPQDTRPTSASWPQIVHDLRNIPSIFHPYLSVLVEKGLSLESVIYSEGKADSIYDVEYTITNFDSQVYLWKNSNQTITETKIDPSSIDRISRVEKLLYCEIEISTTVDQTNELYRFSYNTSQEDMYYTILSVLFGKHYPSSLPQMAAQDNFSKETIIESLAIMNLKKLCYFLGNHIIKYNYFTKESISTINSKKITSEHFYALTDQGYCFIDLDTYFVTTTYYTNNSIPAFNLSESSDGILLQIKTRSETVQRILGNNASDIQTLFNK